MCRCRNLAPQSILEYCGIGKKASTARSRREERAADVAIQEERALRLRSSLAGLRASLIA